MRYLQKESWKSVRQQGDRTARRWDRHHSGADQERPESIFKSLLWVVPLTYPVYFISLFIILTYS